MDKRIPIGVVIGILIIFGALWAYGNLDDILFEQIPYYYASVTHLPGKTSDSGSLGGYYQIYGKGTDFKFKIVLPGADIYEIDLDYDPNGLNGTGKIQSIDITWDTIVALANKDLKKALFNTKLKGVYNMSCAKWNGSGTFDNYGKEFKGTFKIDGQLSYFGGNFTLEEQDNGTLMIADYLWYPQGQPEYAKKVSKTFYM